MDLSHATNPDGSVLAVIARQPARLETPLTGGTAPTVTGIDQVLLEDETTWYQCVYPETGCGKLYASPVSTRSHLVQHSPKRALARLQAEQAAEQEKRSAGARQAAATRKANKTRTPTAEVTAYRASLDKFDRGADLITQGVALCAEATSELAAVVVASASVDPATVEKAAKYDQLRGLIG